MTWLTRKSTAIAELKSVGRHGLAPGLTPGRRRARHGRPWRARGGGEGRGDDLRGTGLRGARGLRRAGLRDRRRAGRARHRAGARRAAAGGCCCSRAAGGRRRRGAGAVAGREPRSRDPSCAGDHRRAAARRHLEPLGRALPAVRSGRLRAPGPGSPIWRGLGLADRAEADLAPWLGEACRMARRRRPGVRRAAARGGGRSGLRLREPRALEQPAADPGAAPGRARRRGPSSWSRSGRR